MFALLLALLLLYLVQDEVEGLLMEGVGHEQLEFYEQVLLLLGVGCFTYLFCLEKFRGFFLLFSLLDFVAEVEVFILAFFTF